MTAQRKIDKENVEDILSLSPLQEGMLYNYIKSPNSSLYNEQLWICIEGNIREELIEKAWTHVIDTNEMLRTVFRWEKLKQPIQVVLKNPGFHIEKYDLLALGDESPDPDSELEKIRTSIKSSCIDIADNAFKVILIRLADKKYEMVVINHHILYDGWSNAILLEEFLSAYKCFVREMPVQKISKNKFKNYIKWISEQDKNKQRLFWKRYLEGITEKTGISADIMTDSADDVSGEYCVHISDTEYAVIKEFCTKNRTTISTLFNAAWAIMLQRYSRINDVVFGTTVSGRNAGVKGIENMVGLFIYTIPLRVRLVDSESIMEMIQRVEKSVREREDYEHTSLADIKSYCATPGNEDNFDSIIVIENYPKGIELNDASIGFSINNYSSYANTNFPLTIAVTFYDKIKLSFIYKSKSFRESTIMQLSKYFMNVLDYLLANPDKKVSEVEIIDQTDKQKLLCAFNDTYTEYPRDKTIHELFEEQVEKTPENVAVVYEDKQLTYRELNEKANQLARVLKEKGVEPDKLVGIMVERSLELIVGIMGILKAGGAYLPIDSEYPTERIEYMLQDSGISILLTQEHLRHKAAFLGEVIELEDGDVYRGENYNLQKVNKPNDLAYVIYTSGTTGKPKGVMIEQKSVIRLVKNTNYIEFKKEDRILQTGAVVFDAITFEIWGALLNGAGLYLARNETIVDPDKLQSAIENHNITTLWLTSPLFNQIVDQNTNVFNACKNLLVGGDVLSPKHINTIKKINRKIKIINGYGPTENTTFTTCFRIEEEYDTNIPIGKPISNTKVYIVDNNNRLQPIGVAGEMCIAGEGLARGYLNSPHLTAEKFIPNPFEPGTRMYRTGDLGRWLSDGNIEFLGRTDHQVKIRGFRIELGEIENRLLLYETIQEAVVVAKEDGSRNKCLCAYIVAQKEVTASELRQYLCTTLPDYMVPSYFIQLDKLPLTLNGKIDWKALPELDGSVTTGTEYEAPGNELEEKLARIFEEALNVEKVGINDNFYDLGGHSLKALQVMNLIYKTMNIKISIQALFESQTIAKLEDYIKSSTFAGYEEIVQLPVQPYYELSYPQKRLWIINQKEHLSTAYNMTGKIILNEKADVKAAERAFQFLIKRHESLRTHFQTVEGSPVQIIEQDIVFDLALRDLSGLEAKEKQMEAAHTYKSIAERHFDLRAAPLLDAVLVKQAEAQYEIIMCMHHIISDGWSMGLLKEEFVKAYEAFKAGRSFELEPLKIQYKDFSSWQNKQISGGKWSDSARHYWYELLKDETTPIVLSGKYQPGQEIDRAGAAYIGNIDKGTKDKLEGIAKQEKVTLFTVLLTALNVFLMDLTGFEDIVVGTAGSGREHDSLGKIVGFFINTTVLKNHITSEERFDTALARISSNTLKALEYQSYPLEKIVDELNIKYPQITVFFNMLNFGDRANQATQRIAAQDISEMKDTKFHITFYITEHTDGIEIECTYIKSLFKASRIMQMLDRYIGLVAKIADDPKGNIIDYL